MKRKTDILSNPYVVSWIAALITFVVYLPSLDNDFVTWDDSMYIYANEHIRSFNLDLIKWAVLDLHAGNWHPVTWISHAFDYAVWGMNPAGHHLSNIVFHALNTFLVTLLAVRLIEIYKAKKDCRYKDTSTSDKSALLAGIVTGLLFGLHPIHVESAAWISERKDVLCAFFLLLAALEYIRYVSERESSLSSHGICDGIQSKYISVFLLFILAALSKPMAITFPVVLLILDWFPLQRLETAGGRRRGVLEKIPFFVVSIVLIGVAFFAQQTAHAVAIRKPIPVMAKVMNATKGVIEYLINLVWPLDLMPFYSHPYWEHPVLTSARYIMPALAAAVISACCMFLVKRQKMWLAVWAVYVVMLLPVLGLVQIGAQGMADRYMYLPSIGPFLVMGTSIGLIGERIAASDAKKTAGAALLAVLCIFIILLSNATQRQIRIWKDGVTLWNYELDMLRKKSDNNWFAYWIAYRGLGEDHLRKGNYKDALNDYSEVIILKPDDFPAYQRRGIAYARLGRLKEAIKDFTAALAINPNSPALYYDRGTAYAKLGSFLEAVNDLTTAISISTKPDANCYLNRGLALKKLGRARDSERDIAEAKRLKNASSERLPL